MMAWWFQMVLGEALASFMAPYGLVEIPAERRLRRTLPSGGRMVVLICARHCPKVGWGEARVARTPPATGRGTDRRSHRSHPSERGLAGR